MNNKCILLVALSILLHAGAFATQYSPTHIDVDLGYGYVFRGLNASGQALFAAPEGALLWSKASGGIQIPGQFHALGFADNGDIVGCRSVSEDGSICSARAFIRQASTGELRDLSLPGGT